MPERVLNIVAKGVRRKVQKRDEHCVVVVDRKTIGPERPVAVFDGIEYDSEWPEGRVSSELTPRPMRTMISENCAEGKRGVSTEVVSERVFRGYVRRCPENGFKRSTCENADENVSYRESIGLRFATYDYRRRLSFVSAD